MGTSNIFNGRNDRNPLLPDDYDREQNSDPELREVITWKVVKSNMSKYITNAGNYGSSRHIVQQYVKAAGGAHKMAAQLTSGIRTGGNIASFFSNIRTDGFDITLHNLGIQFLGKNIKEVFSKLIDVLSPESDTKEDIVAKEASQAALSMIYDYVEMNDMNMESLNNIPLELMNEALCEYIGSHIWITMMKDLGSRFEKYISDSHKAYLMECELKDMIMGIVKVEFNNKGDIINQNVGTAIGELYEQCLKVLEAVI